MRIITVRRGYLVALFIKPLGEGFHLSGDPKPRGFIFGRDSLE
nr:MAG TPA: hypothetical protein [Caudoviricetes sp.]